jgi:hypothetical protein
MSWVSATLLSWPQPVASGSLCSQLHAHNLWPQDLHPCPTFPGMSLCTQTKAARMVKQFPEKESVFMSPQPVTS